MSGVRRGHALSSPLLLLCCLSAWNIESGQAQRYLVWSETFGNVSSISAIEVRETGWHFQNNLATRYVYSPKFSENVTSSITSLGYLHSQDLVFFSDAGTRCIYKLHIDMLSNDLNSPGNTSSDSRAQNNSSQPEVIHCGTSGVIDGIAVDWLSGAVYWTDRAYRTISVVSHRTLMSRTLIKDELEKPGGIAVDPINGFMFWCERGRSPRIERADLQGRNRTVLVTSGITEPTAITMDPRTGKVYFIDRKEGTVQKIDWDGENQRTLLFHAISENQVWVNAVGISVSQGYIYASSIISARMKQIRIYLERTGELLESVDLQGTPTDVISYDRQLQPIRTTDCLRLSCEHICISTGLGNSTCICADGYTLSQERSCIGPPVREGALLPDEVSLALLALSLVLVLAVLLIALLIWISVVICRQRRRNRPPPQQGHKVTNNLYNTDAEGMGSEFTKGYNSPYGDINYNIEAEEHLKLNQKFQDKVNNKRFLREKGKCNDKFINKDQEEKTAADIRNDEKDRAHSELTNIEVFQKDGNIPTDLKDVSESFQTPNNHCEQQNHDDNGVETHETLDSPQNSVLDVQHAQETTVCNAPSVQEMEEIESTLALVDQALAGQIASRDSACVETTNGVNDNDHMIQYAAPVVHIANTDSVHQVVTPQTSGKGEKSKNRIYRTLKGIFKTKSRPTATVVSGKSSTHRRKRAVQFKDFEDPEQDRYANSGHVGSLRSDPYRARRYWKSRDDGLAIQPGLAWKPQLSSSAKGFSPASHGIPVGTMLQTLRSKSHHKQLPKAY